MPKGPSHPNSYIQERGLEIDDSIDHMVGSRLGFLRPCSECKTLRNGQLTASLVKQCRRSRRELFYAPTGDPHLGGGGGGGDGSDIEDADAEEGCKCVCFLSQDLSYMFYVHTYKYTYVMYMYDAAARATVDGGCCPWMRRGDADDGGDNDYDYGGDDALDGDGDCQDDDDYEFGVLHVWETSSFRLWHLYKRRLTEAVRAALLMPMAVFAT